MEQWMLRNDVVVDQCRDDGVSGLLMASQEGHTDIVKFLLEKNPDVNLCDNEGISPLIKASANDHTDIVRLLLEWNPGPCDNTTLSTSYVNKNTSISNSPCLVHPLMKHEPDINAQSYDGGSALYFSAWNGNIEITQILVENNADCNICAHSKQSVTETVNRNSGKKLQAYKQSLFDSLVKETSNHITDYVSKKSVDYVFDVEAGSSPLHMACFLGWIDVVNCLIVHHAYINIKKEDGTTPLFYACELGHADIVHLLLHKGADLQIGRIDEKFPLDIATVSV